MLVVRRSLGVAILAVMAARAGAGRPPHPLGQWGVHALVALHVLATVRHVAVRRDGLLGRMIPRQDDTARLSRTDF